MISRRPSIGRIDYLATKYFRKRMKLSNGNSDTYVGFLVSKFWHETYLNKEILWFSPLSTVLVCTVYKALQFKFSVHSCILCCLIAFPSQPFAYFLTSGYLLQTPDIKNSNSFRFPLKAPVIKRRRWLLSFLSNEAKNHFEKKIMVL